MPNEMTIAAAIIEANRSKNPTRAVIDYDYRARAMNKLIEAAQYRIPTKPTPEERYYGYGRCPTCRAVFRDSSTNFCGNCGQALDWGEGKADG